MTAVCGRSFVELKWEKVGIEKLKEEKRVLGGAQLGWDDNMDAIAQK